MLGGYFGDEFFYFVLLGFEAEGPEGDLELLDVDDTRAVAVEEVEGFLDVLLLFF